MNAEIFRAYDIRGVAATDLNDTTARAIGQALGTVAKRRGARRFGVGRDARLSGPRLRDAVVEGLCSTGLEVHDLGQVPTPLLYFSVFHLDLDGGVQITGSHNPPEYNGFKMMVGKETLHGEGVAGLRALIEAGDFERGEGRVVEARIEDAYLDWVVANIKLGPWRPRVLLDAGHGAAGPMGMALYERLGFDVEGIHIEPDGRFPAHEPDPTTEPVLRYIAERTRQAGADVGIGFDGDGDRVGVVDGGGEIIWGDRLLILFARDLLARHPGAAVVSEVKCSRTLFDDIRARGGEAIMWKAGHSLIKAKMKESGALLAGEMSGHIFFADRFFGFDDAIYVGARLLELLSHAEQGVSALLADVPQTFATPELRIPCPDDRKFDVVARLVALVQEAGHEALAIDGVRVTFPDGWGLVRASNTQAALSVRAEGDSEAARDRIREQLEAWIARASG